MGNCKRAEEASPSKTADKQADLEGQNKLLIENGASTPPPNNAGNQEIKVNSESTKTNYEEQLEDDADDCISIFGEDNFMTEIMELEDMPSTAKHIKKTIPTKKPIIQDQSQVKFIRTINVKPNKNNRGPVKSRLGLRRPIHDYRNVEQVTVQATQLKNNTNSSTNRITRSNVANLNQILHFATQDSPKPFKRPNAEPLNPPKILEKSKRVKKSAPSEPLYCITAAAPPKPVHQSKSLEQRTPIKSSEPIIVPDLSDSFKPMTASEGQLRISEPVPPTPSMLSSLSNLLIEAQSQIQLHSNSADQSYDSCDLSIYDIKAMPYSAPILPAHMELVVPSFSSTVYTENTFSFIFGKVCRRFMYEKCPNNPNNCSLQHCLPDIDTFKSNLGKSSLANVIELYEVFILRNQLLFDTYFEEFAIYFGKHGVERKLDDMVMDCVLHHRQRLFRRIIEGYNRMDIPYTTALIRLIESTKSRSTMTCNSIVQAIFDVRNRDIQPFLDILETLSEKRDFCFPVEILNHMLRIYIGNRNKQLHRILHNILKVRRYSYQVDKGLLEAFNNPPPKVDNKNINEE